MTSSYDIRPAGPTDAEKLDYFLRGLSEDLGHTHLASVDDLVRHGFGENAAFRAVLAEAGNSGEVVGGALYSSIFSTTRGAAGLYVSDLWISKAARGHGLGARLLAAACRNVPESWTIGFIRLAVATDNPAARRFYDRLGFEADRHDDYITLSGTGLTRLKDTP